MNKPAPATARTPVPAAKPDPATSAAPDPGSPAPQLSTQQLIAHISDTLEWRRTLQVVVIIVAAGLTATLFFLCLTLAAHALTGQAAAWPVSISISISISATVSYRAARRRR
jgi:hypothetical protein